MKNKVLRFVVSSVVIISSLYLAFMLLDMNKANTSEKTGENLLLAVIVGLTTSASLVFLTKFLKQPKE